MLWTNECQRVRRQLALSAGGDLSAAELADVQQHVRDCAECRTVGEQLRQGQSVLAETRSNTRRDAGPSLWPQLAERVRAQSASQASSRQTQRAGWIPVAAMAAACAAVVLVAVLDPAFDDPRFLQPKASSSSVDAYIGDGLRNVSEREGQLRLSPQMRRVRSLLYTDSNSY